MRDTQYLIKCSVCKEIKASDEVPFIKVYQRKSDEPNSGSQNTGADVCWGCLKEKLGVSKQ